MLECTNTAARQLCYSKARDLEQLLTQPRRKKVNAVHDPRYGNAEYEPCEKMRTPGMARKMNGMDRIACETGAIRL